MQNLNFRYFFILLFSIFLISCEEDEIKIENPDYTIGTLYEYVPGNDGNQTTVGFTYIVNNKEYHNRYSHGEHGWSIPGNAGYNSGDKFMVEYEINKPEIGKMLFGYSIKDSSDYLRYYKELKNKQ